MLLRRRLTGLDSILGPLFDTQPPPGGAPTGDPAPGAPPPTTGGSGGGTPPPAGSGQPSADGMIPRERFNEVYSELQTLKQAEATRQTEEDRKKGEFEKVADREKARADEALAKATRIARRAAFIAKAAGTVADAEAAYKLAAADGMLDDLKVDDEGDADPKVVEGIVTALVKKYEFLKGSTKNDDRSFGRDQSGAGNGGGTVDRSKMSSRELLSAGYAQGAVRRPGE